MTRRHYPFSGNGVSQDLSGCWTEAVIARKSLPWAGPVVPTRQYAVAIVASQAYGCRAGSITGRRCFSLKPCRYAVRSAISEPLNRGQEISFSRMRFNIAGPCFQRAATISKDVIRPAIADRPGAPLDESS